MIMKTLSKYIAFSLLGISTLLFACERENRDRDTATAEDHALADRLYSDLYSVAEEAVEQGEGSGKRTGHTYHTSCASITIDPAGEPDVWPKNITLDFGTGCTGKDGRTRSGMVHIKVTGPYREPGTEITTTLENYAVDGYRVSGSKVVKNEGRNSNENLHFSIVVEDGSITTPENEQISWSSARQREWIAGEETNILSGGQAGLLDDVYLITGESSGVNRENRAFTVRITEALKVKLDCRWVVQGEISIEPDELEARTLRFGDGNCDNDAVLEVGKFEFDIQLR